MSIKTKMAALMAGIFSLESDAGISVEKYKKDDSLDDDLASVKVGSLNVMLPHVLVGHRSHSSHASHGSHRSSSGGSYRPPAKTYPSTPTPAPAPKPGSSGSGSSGGGSSDPNGKPPKPGDTYSPGADSSSSATDKEQRAILIKRVQLYLKINGYYHGDIDGVMGPQTRYALNKFQEAKGLEITNTLNVQTLDAMGILAK